LSMHALVAKI